MNPRGNLLLLHSEGQKRIPTPERRRWGDRERKWGRQALAWSNCELWRNLHIKYRWHFMKLNISYVHCGSRRYFPSVSFATSCLFCFYKNILPDLGGKWMWPRIYWKILITSMNTDHDGTVVASSPNWNCVAEKPLS